MRTAKPGECVNSNLVTTYTDNGPPSTTVIPARSPLCARCGKRPATQEVLQMVERPGGTVGWCDECATPPQWTNTPPVISGFYWRRSLLHSGRHTSPVPFMVYTGTRQTQAEWWPVRIEPPR